MRFAISLLTVLAIASIIGTVLKQNEPYPNYVIEFGQFWFSVFKTLGLFDVYHTAWFLLILVFLVTSTGVCIYRNAPAMLKEMRTYREHAREESLSHFAHRASYETPLAADSLVSRLGAYLAGAGYRFRVNPTAPGASSVLMAAKAGSYHRLGYILTHAAIVIICVGGLIDGNVPLKVQELLGTKKVETRDIPETQVPAISRLAPSNLSFRGNVTIPEGSSADVIFLTVGDGYLVQDLPFTIILKKFHIEHYSTGQPKTFASDVIVTDKATKKSVATTITVNHPLIFDGVAIYQASFGDGGTGLTMQGWNLFSPSDKPFPVEGRVNKSTALSNGSKHYTLEFTDFRPFNIENIGAGAEKKPADQGILHDAMSVFGQSPTDANAKNLTNVGPSFSYKVRDEQGQAKEYNNYMLPVFIDKRWFLLSGMRDTPGEPFSYVRFPMDENGRIDGFMALRAMMLDKSKRQDIAKRFAKEALQGQAVSDTLRARLVESTVKILDMFAEHGYGELARFIQQVVPKAEQERAAQTYLRILEGSAFEAYAMSRSAAGEQPVEPDATHLQFVRDSLNAISDLFFYGAPVYLQLTQYDQVQASGLQLTRSPGKAIVYAGSALLVLGIFAMFYIRERRIWLLIKPEDQKVLFAMSGNRKTLDFEQEFVRHRDRIADLIRS